MRQLSRTIKVLGIAALIAPVVVLGGCGSSNTPTASRQITAAALAHHLQWTKCRGADLSSNLPALRRTFSGGVICAEGDISFFTSPAREHAFEAMHDAADVIHGVLWGNGFSLSCYSKDVCITAERLLGGSLP